MLDALRHHEHLHRLEDDVPAAQLNRHSPLQHEKQVVGSSVPHELALHLDHHQVVPVELANGSWLPAPEKVESFSARLMIGMFVAQALLIFFTKGSSARDANVISRSEDASARTPQNLLRADEVKPHGDHSQDCVNTVRAGSK